MSNKTSSPLTKHELLTLAVEIFKSEDKANLWFITRLNVLDDKTPEEIGNSTQGLEQIKQALNKIKYGEFS